VAPLLKYTVLRLALFVAAMGLLAVLGAGLIVVVVGAGVISLLLSYVLLRRPREDLTRLIAERTERRLAVHEKPVDADTLIEDAADDAERLARARAQAQAEREQHS
jgi:threonine dehydrogenase-like Zn-dependent dehydrogenase